MQQLVTIPAARFSHSLCRLACRDIVCLCYFRFCCCCCCSRYSCVHLCLTCAAAFQLCVSPDAYVLVPYVLTSGVQAMVPKREKSDLTLKIGAFEGDLDDDQVAFSSASSLPLWHIHWSCLSCSLHLVQKSGVAPFFIHLHRAVVLFHRVGQHIASQ